MIQIMQRGNEPHSGTACICIILQRFLAHTIQDFRNGPGYLSGFIFNAAGIVLVHPVEAAEKIKAELLRVEQ